MRILSTDLKSKLGETVTVSGWVNSRRDHGGLIFIDLRDHKGIIQLVITPDTKEAFSLAETLRDEFVITATGKMRERAPELKNPNIETGDIELVVDTLELLNRSEPLPVNTHDDGPESSEDLRLKYRFLDLRRPKMQNLLRRRSEYYQVLRKYMIEHDFVEVTTPILANSSPEGARDFLVPSRLHPGHFYALPQAPQQFKQLLMVGGVPRYFQIAPCFRDEDPRADRLYGDFYQLDLEMSFVDNGETIREEMEPLIKSLVTDFAGKTLKSEIVPRISYKEAMETYGTDKPDLRYDMPLIELTDVLKNTDFKVFKSPCVKALCVKGGASLSRSQIDNFTDLARKNGAGGLAYILYENGEAKSPIAKFLKPEELEGIKNETGAKDGDAVFFGADTREKVNKVLGILRIAFADHFNLKDDNIVALCWIVDFPMYELDDNGSIVFTHNPFSMPQGGLEALNSKNPLDILAYQYDIVCNGIELSSGAVRNHDLDTLIKAFEIAGYEEEELKSKFTALILCIIGFFGVAGLHRMYVGKVGSGVLHFFTYGLCGIGTIIDLISILSGGFRDSYGQPLV